MATSAARVVQIVRPHIAMIKFPARHGNHSSSPHLSHPIPSSSAASTTVTVAKEAPRTLAESYQKPIGVTPRGSGIDSHLLPPHLQRRPLDDLEIDYINRGGPE